ncbi:MAG: transposase [Candidatus Brocadiae bacterium]|nr:transposase [Candidatus Brocadiia bacterium]
MVEDDPRRRRRRSIRLADRDYSREGAYFVTICAQGRRPFFGDIRDDAFHPNDAGQMIEGVWRSLPSHYSGVDIDVSQLMPNHFHGIVVLGSGAMALPDVVQRLKSLTTTRYIEGVKTQSWPRFDRRLWQRTYHEHVIRIGADLHRIKAYILANPANWAIDRQNPAGEWQAPSAPWDV